MESIEKMTGEKPGLLPGSFAENIATADIELKSLPVETRLLAGEVELEITQIGKNVPSSAIYINRPAPL